MIRKIAIIAYAIVIAIVVIGDSSSALDKLIKDDVTFLFQEENRLAVEDIVGRIPVIKQKIGSRTGLDTDIPIVFIIYKDRGSFLESTKNEMVAAYAVPEENTVVIDLSQMRVHPINLELIIMHELTHLVLHHHIGRSRLPKWFDEGVSEWVSGINEIIAPDKSDVLRRSVIGGTVIPLYRLSAEFPGDRRGFSLAYEESRSVIEFLEREHGEDKIRSIIARMSNGEDINSALRNEITVSVADLERLWLKDLDIRYSWIGYLSNNIIWILFVFGAVVIIIGFIRFRWRLKNYKDDDEDAEIAMLERMYENDESKSDP